jgi:glycosyltransferase involved in cell wall biosynthesis
MNVSVVIPVLNEQDSLVELTQRIQNVAAASNLPTEVIFVDDGSSDGSWNTIEELGRGSSHIKGIRFRRNYGKSAALSVGFEAAQGDVVITMDADLQDDPSEIPELHRMVTVDGYDLVSGWKRRRHDPWTKTVPSRFFNRVTRIMSGIKLHDFNCGLKAYRKDVVKSIEVFGEMHRYIPVIAKQAGFKRIGEKVVVHHARKHGQSKYGFERYMRGFLDLMTVMFVTRFGKRPMHFFGTWGVVFFLVGFGILLWLSIEKLAFSVGGIATRPIFFFGLITLVVGAQLFLTGFLAELISRNAPDRNSYLIESRLNL